MTEQSTKSGETVNVKCLGIVDKMGFTLYPEGMEPKYFDFLAGQATAMPKPYADYIMAQDPARFVEVTPEAKPEAKPQAQAPQAPQAHTEDAKAAKRKAFLERMAKAREAKKNK